MEKKNLVKFEFFSLKIFSRFFFKFQIERRTWMNLTDARFVEPNSKHKSQNEVNNLKGEKKMGEWEQQKIKMASPAKMKGCDWSVQGQSNEEGNEFLWRFSDFKGHLQQIFIQFVSRTHSNSFFLSTSNWKNLKTFFERSFFFFKGHHFTTQKKVSTFFWTEKGILLIFFVFFFE